MRRLFLRDQQRAFVRGQGAVVAIVRFGAAGDVIRTAPAIEALAHAWPRARRVAVTHAHFAPLAKRCCVDIEHVPFERTRGLWPLVRALKEKGVTHVLDLHGTTRSRVLGLLLFSRPRVAVYKRGLTEWARVSLAHAPHRPQRTCAARQQEAIARLTGVDAALPALCLRRPPRMQRQSQQPQVGLSPGANWATKRWPIERWAALAQRLCQEGVQVSVFGSEKERGLCDAVCEGAPRAHPLIGLDWDAFAQSIVNQDVFVCGDSGPLHFAMGLGVKTIGLFLSTPQEAFDDVATVVVQGRANCRPCSFYGREACPRGHGDCWQTVSVAQVRDAIGQCMAFDAAPFHPTMKKDKARAARAIK